MLKMLKKPKKPSTTRQNLLAYLTSTCAGVEHKQTSYTMQQKSHLEWLELFPILRQVLSHIN